MNLPNKLTLLRVILIPVFIFFLLNNSFGKIGFWIALAIFCVASFTDFLDGQIARKYNLVTNFGKFMDPLADKILVYAAFAIMVADGTIPSWTLIIILCFIYKYCKFFIEFVQFVTIKIVINILI